MAGAVSRVGYYDNAGGSFYCDTVSALGGVEGVEAAETGDFDYLRFGGWAFWERGWGRGGGGHYTAGCVENADDARRGEAEDATLVRKHTKRIGTEGFLRGDRPTSVLDQRRRSNILRKLPMG